MINKIVVPLDGSDAAEAVLPYVERIAIATNASLLLLAAVDKPRDWGNYAESELKGERHEAESYLREMQAHLTSAIDNDVETEVSSAAPAEAILAACERARPDLIAMTTHGRSGLSRWVLGSVTTKLLHATSTPMLVVRPPEEGEKREATTISKILVPLDGSELSLSALPFAGDLAQVMGASLVLFHAVFEPVMTYPGSEAIFTTTALEEVEAGARKFLEAAATDLTARGLKVDVAAALGHATDGIVWAAEREGAGLIVMSTHGRSGAGRMVLGSVADAVVRRAPMPVIIVRPAAN